MRPHAIRLLAAAILAIASVARAGDVVPPNVAPEAWAAAAVGSAEVLVELHAKADLAPAASMPHREDRARWVHGALWTTAAEAQRDLRKWLVERRIEHRAFYIADVVWARLDREQMSLVARRPEVERVLFNPHVKGLADGVFARTPDLPDAAPRPAAVEWNVGQVNAPSAWAEGHRGEGIVVGDQDTGMRWTHESLRPHYRGWDEASGTASHDYNWHDAIHAPATGNPCGFDATEPCDDNGHGTHTTGTVVGSDGGANETGIAPGAQWIGCRNMDEGDGTPATYLECFEFFLAPYPVGGDPSMGDPLLAPDVTTNSWVCPPSEGCAWDVFEAALQAHRAAGIFTVVAAGNSGPGCGSIDTPPSASPDAFTVGATDSTDSMAAFSSRGASQPNGLQKPDVVAPGVNIRSTTSGADDSYGASSGTSMATPHVAGVVALLWSARPAYRNRPVETAALIDRTARRLTAIVEACPGDYVDGPNGTWGHGLVDVTAMLAAACDPAEAGCTDGFDSDCDGALDCDDADCDGDAACFETSRCADGRDNDGDGALDCDDADCDGDAACFETSRCADGRDNDGDGALDCDDADCDGDAACFETSRCADGRDNDGDGALDCDDADCDGDAACFETSRCADGRDNDGDGALDCDDADCDGDAACFETSRCADGRDNDGDGALDCDDADCDGDAACFETSRCADGRDNDGDGALDCDDADCDGDAACFETSRCADGRDNDGDGALDCDDADCDGDAACFETSRCADGRDNDGDGALDCDDADCDGDAACFETSRCADGRDNDGDGALDCDDADCDGDAACFERSRCTDGRDNDGDGALDCDDAECVADAACDATDLDGDGAPNASDCRPVDPSVFAAAPEVARIDVVKGPGAVRVSWSDVSTLSGSGTTYDVAMGTLAAMRAARAARPSCVVRGIAALEMSLPAVAPSWIYLVRATTPCGPGPQLGWGTDSIGTERAACP